MQWNHPLLDTSSKSKVAQASKNARERRKKEFETLMEENQKLREEREKYLLRIEHLQLKVVEMREDEGDIDLQLENELLKAQLSEHSLFVNGLIKMSDGVPTSALEKKQLYRQGADYANVHITSLLTRSVRLSGQWQSGKVPSCGSDLQLSVCFQHVVDPASGARRLNMRTDQVFPFPATADMVSAVYWSLWTNNDVVRSLIEESNMSASGISTSTILHSDELNSDSDESLATLYTRDENQHHVFVASKRETSIARGSLAVAIDGDDVQGELAQPWKRRKCQMCARSNTNVNRLQEVEGNALAKQELNNPTYVEGCAVWDLDGDRGCRVAAIMSIVDGFKVGNFCGFDMVSADGAVSESFVALSRAFMGRISQGIAAAAASAASPATKKARSE